MISNELYPFSYEFFLFIRISTLLHNYIKLTEDNYTTCIVGSYETKFDAIEIESIFNLVCLEAG